MTSIKFGRNIDIKMAYGRDGHFEPPIEAEAMDIRHRRVRRIPEVLEGLDVGEIVTAGTVASETGRACSTNTRVRLLNTTNAAGVSR
jgi:hypothetical protein